MIVLFKNNLVDELKKYISNDDIYSIFFTMAQIFISEYRCGVEIKKDRFEIYVRNVKITGKDIFREFFAIIKDKYPDSKLYKSIEEKDKIYQYKDENDNPYFDVK